MNLPIYKIPQKQKNRVQLKNDRVNDTRSRNNIPSKYRDHTQDEYFHRDMFSTAAANVPEQ